MEVIKKFLSENKIAIIEDELDILDLYKELFSIGSNYSVDYYSSSAKFLKADKSYSMLIVDLFMPDISGMELIENYSREHENTKIIIVSGAPDSVINKQQNPNIVDIFRKPVNIMDLFSSIEKFMESDK